MMNCIVKQRINTLHRIPPHVFDSKHEEDYSSVYIVSNGIYCGLISEDNTELLPLEYDNITVIGFGLLQLVQGGRLGLAHLWRDSDKPNLLFTLKNVIPCEYDVIDCPWKEGVAVLRKDEPTGMKVRAYFSVVNVLTHYFEDYTILDRDILEMRSADGSFLFDGRNGRMFCHHKNVSLSTFDAPSAEEDELDRFEVGGRGIVIATLGKRNSLIYYNGKQALPYYYDGEAHPIFKATSCDLGDRPVIDGFILEENDSMVILSNDCERIHTDDLANIQVFTRLDAYSATGNQDVVFQFDGELFCCEKIMDEFFKNCNELFETDDE